MPERRIYTCSYSFGGRNHVVHVNAVDAEEAEGCLRSIAKPTAMVGLEQEPIFMCHYEHRGECDFVLLHAADPAEAYARAAEIGKTGHVDGELIAEGDAEIKGVLDAVARAFQRAGHD